MRQRRRVEFEQLARLSNTVELGDVGRRPLLLVVVAACFDERRVINFGRAVR